MKGVLKRLGLVTAAVIVAAIVGFVVFTPFVVVEIYAWFSYPTVFDTPKPGRESDEGVRWFGGYYAVERLDDRT